MYGFRVPMVVISPYARLGYISHVTHDFGSILKFIESTFNLPSLGYADAPADNLSDFFNFESDCDKVSDDPAAGERRAMQRRHEPGFGSG